MPARRNAATKLWPGAKSATAAPCKANGAHSNVGGPLTSVLKSRNRTVLSSSAIVWGFAHFCSRDVGPSRPMAKLANCLAAKPANSLTAAATKAGQERPDLESYDLMAHTLQAYNSLRLRHCVQLLARNG